MATGYDFVYANNVNTTLLSAITSTQTTITLASSANLPTLTSGQTLALTLNDAATQTVFEIVYVTAISGAVLTVTRGMENTTAQAWNAGDYAYAAVTAGALDQIYPAFVFNGSLNPGNTHWTFGNVTATSSSTTVTFIGAAIFTVNAVVLIFDVTSNVFTNCQTGILSGFTFTSTNGHTYSYLVFGS